jgi:hypothetical protein
MPWDCLAHAHAFLYYGSTKDVSNSIGTIHNSNFTYHFTNLFIHDVHVPKIVRDVICTSLEMEIFLPQLLIQPPHLSVSRGSRCAISIWSGYCKFVVIAADAEETWSLEWTRGDGDGWIFVCAWEKDGWWWWVMRDFRAIYWNLQRVHTGA